MLLRVSIVLAALILAAGTCASQAAGSSAASIANGKAIFQTGIDRAGSHIAASPPALMPSCAACHHADGSGGLHLPGGAVSADLRHAALITSQHPPYTLALLERAISTGIDNQGHPLNKVMPRWRLSKTDLHDVAEFVLTSLK